MFAECVWRKQEQFVLNHNDSPTIKPNGNCKSKNPERLFLPLFSLIQGKCLQIFALLWELIMDKIKFKNLSGWLKLAAIVAWIIAGGWVLGFLLVIIAFAIY
ncbi:hypothetical protein ES703_109061 [subsurface metagenome]